MMLFIHTMKPCRSPASVSIAAVLGALASASNDFIKRYQALTAPFRGPCRRDHIPTSSILLIIKHVSTTPHERVHTRSPSYQTHIGFPGRLCGPSERPTITHLLLFYFPKRILSFVDGMNISRLFLCFERAFRCELHCFRSTSSYEKAQCNSYRSFSSFRLVCTLE